MDELVQVITWIKEAEENAKDLAERICEQIAEEAKYALLSNLWCRNGRC